MRRIPRTPLPVAVAALALAVAGPLGTGRAAPPAGTRAAAANRNADAAEFLVDLNRFAPAVARMDADLDRTALRPSAVRRDAARIRRDLAPVAALLDHVAAYRVTDTELEHRREGILRTGRPALATAARMLSAAAAGDDAATRAAARLMARRLDALNHETAGD